MAVLLLAVALLFQMTPPEGLSAAGFHSLILFGAAIFLWVSGLLPIAVTALLSMVSLPLLGIMDKKSTYALFGNEAVFFILGAFILAAALTGTGLSARLARAMLVRFGKTPTRLALTVFLLSALLSFVMSEHAVAAIMFPVIAEIATALKLEKGSSSFGRLLFMSIAWGCIIGGIATFLGGARAPLAVGMLRENTGLGFSFMEWSFAACMIVFPLLVIGFLLLLRFFPVDIASVEEGLGFLNRKRLETGKIGYNEMITAVVMVVTVGSWILLGERVGLASIAILGSAALFTFRVVTWQTIEEYVNWGIILMYGGSISLAAALEKTGAAIWLVKKGVGVFNASPFDRYRGDLVRFHRTDRVYQPCRGGRDPDADRDGTLQDDGDRPEGNDPVDRDPGRTRLLSPDGYPGDSDRLFIRISQEPRHHSFRLCHHGDILGAVSCIGGLRMAAIGIQDLTF